MGYFRILYYISYIFNTVSRLIRRNKKFFMTFLIVGLILFMFLSNQSHAVYYGDDTYTDVNNNIPKVYDSVCMDYLERFDTLRQSFPNNSLIKEIEGKFASTFYDYYIFYGDFSTRDGSSMLNGSPNSFSRMYIVFYVKDNNGFNVVTSATYENYMGYDCMVKTLTSSSSYNLYYILYGNDESAIGSYTMSSGSSFSIPYGLFHNHNKYIYEYYYNNLSLEQIELLHEIDSNVNEINESITNNEMTQEQEEETNDVIEDSKSIFDTEYSQDYHSYISSFYSSISDKISDYVANPASNTYIDFTLPFVNYTYRLHSSAISSVLLLHDRNNTIRNFITLFWWVAFSVPIFYLLRRIIVWFGTGEFLNKPSKFALYMTDFIDKNITPGMM